MSSAQGQSNGVGLQGRKTKETPTSSKPISEYQKCELKTFYFNDEF